MFDLEPSIADWRRQMLAAGIARGPLEELETHLREEIGQQTRSGLNVQQAFAMAIERLGQAHALKVEFKKVGGDVRSPFWPVVFAFSSFAFFVTALFSPLFMAIAFICVVTASVWEISPTLTVICVVALSGIVLWPLLRPGAKSWLLPFLFGLIVLILAGCAFVYTYLLIDFNVGEHSDVCFDPNGLFFLAMGAALCICQGLAVKSRWHFLARRMGQTSLREAGLARG